jgi:hypothetical protein
MTKEYPVIAITKDSIQQWMDENQFSAKTKLTHMLMLDIARKYGDAIQDTLNLDDTISYILEDILGKKEEEEEE